MNEVSVPNLNILRSRLPATIVDGALVHVLGYATPGDGGGGLFRWSATSVAPDDGGLTISPGSATGRWLRDLAGMTLISSQMFGGLCDASHADTTAPYQAAINTAQARGLGVHFGGPDVCVTTATLHATNKLRIAGDGPNLSSMVTTGNYPLLTWTVTADTQDFDVGGFSAINQTDPASDNSLASVIRFEGTNGSHLSFGRFHDIDAKGMARAFIIDAAPVVTGNGLEGALAWNDWARINILPGTHSPAIGWYSAQGSGTGNTYRGIKAAMAAEGRVWDFQGPGTVVGDIVIEGGHFGGDTGSALMRVGAGTVYRTNIAVVASQVDAGMLRVFDLAGDYAAAPFNRITFIGNNAGGDVAGGVVVATVPLVNSVIDDQLASDWKIGTVKVSAREGPQTMALFSVATAAPLDGMRCDITISGFVAGLGGGVTAASYILGVNGRAATVVPLTAPATTIADAGFYSLSVNSSGQTFRFATAFRADGPGSTVNAHLHCTGGAFVATRL